MIELNSDTQVGSDPRVIPRMRDDIMTLRDELEEVIESLGKIDTNRDKIGMLADNLSLIEDKVEALEAEDTTKYMVVYDPIDKPLNKDGVGLLEEQEAEFSAGDFRIGIPTPTQKFSWNWIKSFFKWK